MDPMKYLMNRCLLQEENEKILWGREDDETCVEEFKVNKNNNNNRRLCQDQLPQEVKVNKNNNHWRLR